MDTTRRFAVRLVAAIGAVVAVACSSAGGDDGSVTAVATAYPLAWLASEIAPDADVTALTSAGQDPHDLELTPQQRGLLEQSDVVVHLGQIGFQPQVESAISDAGGQVVEAATVAGPDRLRSIDGGGIDPHVWFDLGVMADLAEATGDAFAAADPSAAAQYRERADRVATDLRALREEVDGVLSDCAHREVVVSHEAYAYLLAAHELEQHGISGAAGHAGGSPQDIARLTAEIRAEGISAVLSEPVEGRTDAEAVAAEAGVELIDIYSLDIVDEAQARKGFPTLIREQADAVARAAQCAGAGGGT